MYKILANTIFLGKDVHFLPECHSTNDTALQLVRQGEAKEGTIVITANQTRGKGQRGNVWNVQPGANLTFSIVLRPDFMDISEQFYLNMAISNAIKSVLSDYVPALKVKWPNDLVVPGAGKLGGILIENSIGPKGWEYAVAGMGLNINQVDFSVPGPVSLKALTGSQFDLEELFRLLVTEIEQMYILLKKGKWDIIRNTYLADLFLNGVMAEYETDHGAFRGKITGVDPFGRLQVEMENGEIQQYEFKTIRFPSYQN
ncbi:biotin--[acetyl-CoA-carboxylase] ligase [Algoriphagus vanfongensis]|uniref:biotin--[acetyl-CoA-carboxylase] ligase n=1 Tax=Algoriphagus vanfongensis TaxID=426371 RepID=UPI000415B3CE|nr:biotin--[acetyl-CoA-carboxylase] ligase [Algoriphagus vanfongensis]